MQKIPTLFVRDDNDRRYVLPKVTPGCEWVLAGEGRCTRKFDGTCVMFDGSRWWGRREVKPGKPEPADFKVVQHDETTGKTVGWEPIQQTPFYKFWAQATDLPAAPDGTGPVWEPGTYELIGPKVNGNPERVQGPHQLVPHGRWNLGPSDRSFESIRDYLRDVVPPIEGFVFHHADGRMAKIKRRDFPS